VRRILVAGTVLALLATGLAWWQSDRRRIESRLDRLVRACEKEGPESALALFGRTETILDTLAPEIRVPAGPYAGALSEPREVVSAIHRYRATVERVRVRTSERRLEIARGGGRAEMSALFEVSGERGGRPGRERFRARLFWIEEDGSWRIRELEILEVMERSGRAF
jgi:hypothetical protein